jgi:ACR3 family arsenite transporter
MRNDANPTEDRKMTNVFERYLTAWVLLCIIAGILLGKVTPEFARYLDGLAIYVKGAPVVSIPIAVCLFFMMYPTDPQPQGDGTGVRGGGGDLCSGR